MKYLPTSHWDPFDSEQIETMSLHLLNIFHKETCPYIYQRCNGLSDLS